MLGGIQTLAHILIYFYFTSTHFNTYIPTFSKINACKTIFIFFKLANGWIYGEIYSDSSKVQPLMKPYKLLSEKVRFLSFLLYSFNLF